MSALEKLRQTLGNVVFTDEASCFNASFDAMKLSFMPEAVIRPVEEEQVGKMLALAHEYGVGVTTRGAGSSLTGSAGPAMPGAWVLDVTQLNAIEIDPLNKFAYVGAGAITQEIQDQAEAQGLFYPPDPSSRKFCTIGGNIACNAGGLRGVKYGVTRDYVVALRGFMANGDPVAWGLPLKKYASGYNLRDLWVGSEGTLGVITHAVLKLLPKPKHLWTCLAQFNSASTAILVAQKILQVSLPAALEFLDELTVSDPQDPHCALIVELDEDLIEEQKALILSLLKEYAVSWKEAITKEDALPFWQFRRQCSSAMFKHGNAKLNEDIVVPLNALTELIEYVQQLSQETALKIPVFGHIGDGNLHVNIMYNREDEVQCKHAEQALERLMKKVVALKGAITGEHGIGLAKSPFFYLQHTPVEINVMLAIKKTLDPKNILNPGKIFQPFEVWKHKPVNVKLPWDHL